MALGDVRFMQGFESGDPAKDGLTVVVSGGTITETATNKRTGDFCLRLNRTTANALRAQARTDTPVNAPFPSGMTQSGVVFSLYVAALPSANIGIYNATVLSGNDLTLFLSNTGALTAQGTGGVVSGTIATLAAGQRYRIELIHDLSTSPATHSVRVNGGATVSVTAGNNVGTTWNGVNFGTGTTTASTFDLYYDDLVVTEGAAFPGDYWVEVSRPQADLTDLNATWSIVGTAILSRADAVNDAPPDDATSYITSSTASAAQLLPMVDKVITGTLKAVQQRLRTGSTATTGTRTVSSNLRDGAAGTDAAATSHSASINGWRDTVYPTPLLVPPSGGAWDQTKFNNLVMRLVKSATADEARVTQAFMTAASLQDGGATPTPAHAWGIIPMR